MTTIAYKDGVLSCDKQASDNDLRARAACKLIRTSRYAYAICGDLSNGTLAVQWLRGKLEDEDPPELGKKTSVIRMDLDSGDAVLYEDVRVPLPVEDRLYAWGSGGEIAIGAMAHGATPAQAVRIASNWDAGTGLGVQTVTSRAARERAKGEGK